MMVTTTVKDATLHCETRGHTVRALNTTATAAAHSTEQGRRRADLPAHSHSLYDPLSLCCLCMCGTSLPRRRIRYLMERERKRERARTEEEWSGSKQERRTAAEASAFGSSSPEEEKRETSAPRACPFTPFCLSDLFLS